MGIKYQVNEDFFKIWTPEMAYTLGYFYADGSMEDAAYIRGKYIRVSSIDKETIEKIKRWLDSEHTIVERPPVLESRKVSYLLRIGNHEIYDDLLTLGLYPNKSLTVTFPKVPKKHLNHFVRGYFDGDGCVRIAMKKGVQQQAIINKLSSVFTSGSKIFLEELAILMNEIAGTVQVRVYNSHKSYMLSYSTSDSVKLFKFMYEKVPSEGYLKRKAFVYRDYFRLRPQRLDKKVKSVLQCLS